MLSVGGSAMGNLGKVSLFLRRLGLSLLLAFLLISLIAVVYPEGALSLFLPSWIALLIASPYLDRKLKRPSITNIPQAGALGVTEPEAQTPLPPTTRAGRPTAWGRVIVTGLVSFAVTLGITLLPLADLAMLAGPLIWICLYYGWPGLSRWLPLPGAWKAKAQAEAVLSAAERSFWRVLGRGALALLGVVTVVVLLPAMITAPVARNFVRARKVHDSIRTGMTVPEVLDASRDCALFGAVSGSSSDGTAAGDEPPAMSLSRFGDGTYQVDGVALTETQAVERLQAKMHEGYRWRSNCIYATMTSMHVSFSVMFGPDGRVAEVTPVRGWE